MEGGPGKPEEVTMPSSEKTEEATNQNEPLDIRNEVWE